LEEVIETYAANTLEKLKWNVEDAKEDLDFKLQKTCLPRPQVLGKYNKIDYIYII
jgi:hypothetical protein